MSAPKIGKISENLSSCSLTGSIRSDRLPPAISPAPRPVNQLPPCWEQCHDVRTGEVYYFNWSTGRRTTEDPRLFNNAHYSDEDSEDDEEESSHSSSQHDDADTYFSSGDSSSTVSSTSSSACSPEVTSSDSSVLVATGCTSCYMYFMVPKYDSDCPRCGRLLLHFGRRG